MNLGKTLFAQIMDFVPWTSFARIVDRYGGDSRVRSLSCPEQPPRWMGFFVASVAFRYLPPRPPPIPPCPPMSLRPPSMPLPLPFPPP